MKKELIAHEDPKSPISEIFRTLRTNIQFMNNKKKLQTILITSTLPGEGKSWVSSNLATTFAQAGKKVILIDADMRKGRQYTIFGIAPRPGLSNYLSNFEEEKIELTDYIQETEVDGLYVIPAGNVPPNPSELLVSENMLNLIESLKEICDIVILDGPPTQLVTDSLIMARIVDSTVIVTASNQTKKDELRRIVENIKNVGGKIAGIVVNKVTISAKRYEQTYYYGSTSQSRSKNMKEFNKRKVSNNANRNIERARKAVETNYEKENRPNNIRDQKGKQELQKTLKPEKKNQNKEEASIDKTTDILKQINEYLDKEKKNLNQK